MALVPKAVNTRKIALVVKLGYDGNQVITESFDDAGFEILGEHTDGRLVIENDRLLTTRIDWPDHRWSQRANAARIEDFAEMVGKTAAEVRAMEEWSRRMSTHNVGGRP